ncbi:uncharacterized protein CC84DRAFT_1149346 [Paraphaeosphaeria sporulosa]|uniref:Mtf2-like C-terminal domain-containing protein n=1 Tax=Paraphaeosphaeria sporulosa TaxID=1460663 RepID=A0A177CAC6_9PLEO|nr:uncharacterized protein CC84DRAFT_1149346 [Paraphaeosphaeria sporulosa]OAG03728.1 hypothetical protein CC84DRAFT_1149346 [Paraphaeosphaeria sporulosa]
MSVCLCSFRALSRSRTSSSKTLAPFLYQTATIQQRNPISRRHASDSSRPNRPHDVPFEGEELPPTVDEASVNRRTTITGSERAAFEKLYKNTKRAEEQKLNEHELDQIADEYYEDDDDNSTDKSSASLDDLFDAVLSGKTDKPTRSFTPARARRQGPSTDLESLAKELLAEPAEQEKRRKKEEAVEKQKRVKALRSSEKERIKALFEAAPTDQALWAVLEKEVLSVIRGMDLENGPGMFSPKSKTNSKSKLKSLSKPSVSGHKGDPSPTDPTIVYPNYSSHLIAAANTLRKNFPASPLMFNILPTVKDLGRSSYALGASTGLYKALIRAAFRRDNNYPQICALLQDMDNGGIEYDFSVLAFVDEILATHAGADKGHYGRSLQAVVRLELYQEGAEKLRAWRAAIARRLGDFTEEKKDKGQLLRKFTPGRPGGLERRRKDEDEVFVGPARMKLGGGHLGGGANEDIPLVEGDVPFEELGTPAPEMEIGMHADVEGFMRDEVEAPVEAPVVEGVEAAVPGGEGEGRLTTDEEEARRRPV